MVVVEDGGGGDVATLPWHARSSLHWLLGQRVSPGGHVGVTTTVRLAVRVYSPYVMLKVMVYVPATLVSREQYLRPATKKGIGEAIPSAHAVTVLPRSPGVFRVATTPGSQLWELEPTHI